MAKVSNTSRGFFFCSSLVKSDSTWPLPEEEDTVEVEFMSLVFTRMLGQSYRRRLRPLLLRLSAVFER